MAILKGNAAFGTSGIQKCDWVCDTCDTCIYDTIEDIEEETKKEKTPTLVETNVSETPFLDKISAWRSLPDYCMWFDIKVSTYYHLPPIMDDKRRTIFVVSWNGEYITYHDVINGKKSELKRYLYRSDVRAKFLMEEIGYE